MSSLGANIYTSSGVIYVMTPETLALLHERDNQWVRLVSNGNLEAAHHLVEKNEGVVLREPSSGTYTVETVAKWASRVAAEVGTDTATIVAISPETLNDLINEGEWETHADALWGDALHDSAVGGDDPWEEMMRLIREHGGAVFYTGGDGSFDVTVDGARREQGFLPPYGTPSYGKSAVWQDDLPVELEPSKPLRGKAYHGTPVQVPKRGPRKWRVPLYLTSDYEEAENYGSGHFTDTSVRELEYGQTGYVYEIEFDVKRPLMLRGPGYHLPDFLGGRKLSFLDNASVKVVLDHGYDAIVFKDRRETIYILLDKKQIKNITKRSFKFLYGSLAPRVASQHQARVVTARLKEAGWWALKDDPDAYMGDGPLDARIDFIAKIDEMYCRSWNRHVTVPELQALLEVPSWADDDDQQVFGSWPMNQWIDVAAQYMDVPYSVVLSLPQSSLDDARRLWREVVNSRIQVGMVFTKDTVLPEPDKELIRGFLDHIKASFFFAQRDAVEMVDAVDPDKLKLASRKTAEMSHGASIALMKWLSNLAQRLGVAKHVYVVGGAVRNFLIEQPIKDIDMVVDSVALGGRKDSAWLAEQVARSIPARTEIVTDALMVAKVLIRGSWVLDGHEMDGNDIEIVNARAETYEQDTGHKPTEVTPTTIEEDVYRREFTFNTLMWRLLDLANGPDEAEIIDITGCGVRDLENREMRCPADPDKTFNDDPTRIIRTIKFAFKYGMKLPPDTKAAAKRQAKGLKRIPSKAWGALQQIVLESPQYKKALEVMADLGVIDVIKEMVQENQQFATTLANYAKARGVAFMFDLMDLGVPIGTTLSFMDARQQARFREVTTPMDRDAALEFLEMVRNPGNAYKDKRFIPSLAMRYGFKGKAMARFMPVVIEVGRRVLLEQPELANNPNRLKQVVEQGVEEAMKRTRLASYQGKIPGGLAEKEHKKPSDFDPKELAMGIEVEKEHLVGGDYTEQEMEDRAREISMDHLAEIPDYYTRLKKMEAEAEGKKASRLVAAWGRTIREATAPDLDMILDSMDLPPMRRDTTKAENVRWLLRNMGIQNKDHRYYAEALKALKALAKSKLAAEYIVYYNDPETGKAEQEHIDSEAVFYQKERQLHERGIAYTFDVEKDSKLYGLGRGMPHQAQQGDRSSVGLFIPVPDFLAKQFPSLGADDTSPPHVTLFYGGAVPANREDEYIEVLRKTLAGIGPVKARIGDLDYFTHVEKNRRVAFVRVWFSKDMGSVRDRIRNALDAAGFDAEDSFPLAYNPHITLEYMPDLYEEYAGEVPEGDWMFDSIPVWGMPEEYDISLLGGKRSRVGSLLPIMDPMHNLRECAKQLVLLEDHLFQPQKRCVDCIKKHLLFAEALAEEAVTLDREQQYNLAGLPEDIRAFGRELPFCSLEETASKLRGLRKALMLVLGERVFTARDDG